MRESDFYKKVIEENIVDNEKIKKNVLNATKATKRKAGIKIAVLLMFLALGGTGIVYAFSSNGILRNYFQGGNAKEISEYVDTGKNSITVGDFKITQEESLMNEETGTRYLYFSIKRMKADTDGVFATGTLFKNRSDEVLDYCVTLGSEGIQKIKERGAEEKLEGKMHIYQMIPNLAKEVESGWRVYFDEEKSTEDTLYLTWRIHPRRKEDEAATYEEACIIDRRNVKGYWQEEEFSLTTYGASEHGIDFATGDVLRFQGTKTVSMVTLTGSEGNGEIIVSPIDMQVKNLPIKPVLESVDFIDTDWELKNASWAGEQTERYVVYPFNRIVDIENFEITIDGITYERRK